MPRGEGGGSGSPSWELTEKGYELIREHAVLGCPVSEIAEAMRVDAQWLSKRIEESPICDPLANEAYLEGMAEYKKNLRASQIALSASNAQMAIFLGKQSLGQRDQQTIEVNKRVQVVGALPDYAQSPEDWQKVFAPRAQQPAIPLRAVEDAEIVESKE